MPPVSRRTRNPSSPVSPTQPARTSGAAQPTTQPRTAPADRFDGSALRPRDRVEVKLTLKSRDFDKLARALGLAPGGTEQKQVVFFDTPDRALFDKGVVLRFGLENDGDQEATVKLRPLRPDEVPLRMVGREGFKVETDLVGSRATPSASYSLELDHNGIREIASGDIDDVFTRRQEDFVEKATGVDIDWDRLRVTAPSSVEKWELRLEGVKEPVTIERWQLPDGSHVLEASAKTTGAKAEAVRLKLEAALARAGVKPSTTQETKTRTALRFLR